MKKSSNQTEDLFFTALELSPERRINFLDEKCAGDPALKEKLAALLAADENVSGDDFLERSAVEQNAEILSEKLLNDAWVGKKIGRYRISGKISQGGMGAVYLALRDDKQFEKRVALKIIKRGMNSEAILQRFLLERQILANLEHPNIARLLDAGMTEDETPYFVMEYVEGEPLDDFCVGHDLSLEEKLELFRKVCSAVDFAHRNLIVHRDLKPSNILITVDGTPKLLDFGIAKLMGPDNLETTAADSRVLTPAYASPEQLKGGRITTATDIYSLGVILFELLTGHRPYKTDSDGDYAEYVRVVCETEPVRPSSAASRFPASTNGDAAARQSGQPITGGSNSSRRQTKLLKGDLDNIILKALRKEPDRRYLSVEQFSEDVRRHQAGLPVSASKDTWNYRAQKFLARHRYAAAASGLILLTMLAGMLATLYQADKANRRFNDVRLLANSFLFEFHDSIENLPGSTPARELVVKRALEYLDKLAQESGGDATLQRELATAYDKIGKIQGNSYYLNLGDTEGATKSAEISLRMREKLIAADSDNRDLQFELASSYQAVGDMLYTKNELEAGLENYKKSLIINEKLVARAPENLSYLFALAENHTRIGDISGFDSYPNLGDTQSSIENYRRAVAIGEKLTASSAASEKDNLSYRNSLATWTINLSMLASTTGDNASAISDGQKAIAVYEKIIAANPNNTPHQLNLLAAFNIIRMPLSQEMRFDEAIKYMQLAVKKMEEMSAADPKNTFISRSLGVSYNALGRTQVEANEVPGALENHRKALKIAEALLASDPTSQENLRDVASTLEFTAYSQLKAGAYEAALADYRKSLAIYEQLLRTGGSSDDLAGVYSGIGKCLAATGNVREAAEIFRRAGSSVEKAAHKSPLNVRKQSRLALYYFEGGKILAKNARTLSGDESRQALQEAKEWLEKSAEIFGALQGTGKLSKINAGFPAEIERELKQL